MNVNKKYISRMNKLIGLLEKKKIEVPDELIELLNSCKS